MSLTSINQRKRNILSSVLVLVALCLIVAIVLGMLITWASATDHMEIVFWGFVSFVCMTPLLGIIFFVINVFDYKVIKLKYPILSNMQKKGTSQFKKERQQANLDPYFQRSRKRGLFMAGVCLLTWLLIFLTTTIGAFVFKIPIFINLLEKFK